MTVTLSTDEFEAAFEETLERVFSGERIVITLEGEPAAMILHPQDPLSARYFPDDSPDP